MAIAKLRERQMGRVANAENWQLLCAISWNFPLPLAEVEIACVAIVLG
ncbi:hypothetical protein HU230_0020955 [Bradyrhizobium quebecense]|uniref:Uncharacterized protein n=1 Tax=Bradyrhizobium quebecense TaxID=2748629 RepID=A0A973WN34_9BRAD|nr:hypothetical protein [Bradyrhizobium quebecense]UGA48367.1 hypothetical protein HU230_0020955 [Bradyrhizobium quebecense]